MNKEESIQKIQDQIDKVKEYLEYGMPYSEYLDLQLAFDDIVNLIQKQDKIIESYKEILKWTSHERKNNTMDYVKVNKKNKFGTNGICQDMRAFKRTGKIKYRAYIVFQGKQYSLGSHDSLEEAKKARANAEEKIKCIKEYLKKEVEKNVKD